MAEDGFVGLDNGAKLYHDTNNCLDHMMRLVFMADAASAVFAALERATKGGTVAMNWSVFPQVDLKSICGDITLYCKLILRQRLVPATGLSITACVCV